MVFLTVIGIGEVNSGVGEVTFYSICIVGLIMFVKVFVRAFQGSISYLKQKLKRWKRIRKEKQKSSIVSQELNDKVNDDE